MLLATQPVVSIVDAGGKPAVAQMQALTAPPDYSALFTNDFLP